MNSVGGLVDFIEELRLRRWARENYVPSPMRESNWHPLVHDEMSIIDTESSEANTAIMVQTSA